MDGLFGDMFDMNRDGEMDAFELTMEMEFIESVLDKEYEEDEEDEVRTELELAGLDPEELEFMDEDERRELLEDAGLDPDDYVF